MKDLVILFPSASNVNPLEGGSECISIIVSAPHARIEKSGVK